jgi:iron(III) transport system substrate-binding protein
MAGIPEGAVGAGIRQALHLWVVGLAVAIGLAATGGAPARAAEDPAPDYGPGYAEIVAAATREGTVSVYSTTDAAEAAEFLAGFRARYPAIAVAYADLNSNDLHDRFLSEADAGTGSGDVLWSSAMDLQIKLVNDGYAQPYASPEAGHLPSWAVWRNEAYGITAEPIVIAYNRRLLGEAEVPRTHADLTRLLAARPDDLKGKVATYDPERSGVGFLFITRDVEFTRTTWDLVRAMGQVGLKLYSSTGTMLDRIAAGEHLIAYNIIGSYARERAKADSALGLVLTADYTIVMSRIAFIPKAARHPNAARLFLDYLLSRDGQRRLAAHSLGPVRNDLVREATGDDVALDARARPIRVGPELLTYLDQAKRARFLRDWQRALQGR